MSDLIKYSGSGGRISRWSNPEGHAIVKRAQLDALQVDADAALAGRIMERVVDVDGYRRALANGDEVLAQMLWSVEANFLAKCQRTQRGF